jgi:HEAT repeat protein
MDQVEELIAMLKDTGEVHAFIDPRVEIRVKALNELGEIADRRAVEPLIQVLISDLATIRTAAAEALGKIGDVRAVGPLIHTLEDAENAPTGLMKLIYMRSGLVKGRSIPWCSIKHDFEVAAITSTLYSAARKAIIKIGSPAVESLIGIFEGDNGNQLWREAARLLWEIGDCQARQVINRALKHENHYIRAKLVRILGEIYDNRIDDLLIQSLEDEDWGVRWAAVNALKQKRSPQAKTALIKALEDTNPDVRKVAEEALRGKI